MTIATFNIDWAKVQSSKSHIVKIETFLNTHDFDIIVITESVHLNLPAYNYVYKTKQIPEGVYEGLNYFNYLKGNPAYRVSIYSKYKSNQSFKVTDDFTSICELFETSIGAIVIYGTIVGTWFNKKPYAQNELNNCIADCLRISSQTNFFCLAGDMNTSFIASEELQIPGVDSRQCLSDLCRECGLDLTIKNISNNIDHIFLSRALLETTVIHSCIFIEKNKLSDHQGIAVDINIK